MEGSATSSSSSSNIKSRLWDMMKWAASTMQFSVSINRLSATTASLFLVLLFFVTYDSTTWFQSHLPNLGGRSSVQFTMSMLFKNSSDYPKRDEYILNCTASSMTITCPANYPPKSNLTMIPSSETCPEYFRWIHEDLKTWREKGITKDMVDMLKDKVHLKKKAHFRLVIVNGTAYVKQYFKAYQTRDVYTLWGILQLLKLYPGMLPDLDLVFQCHDEPTIKKRKFFSGYKASSAPPQFHYCGDESTYDIVFPDFSFWGWPGVNVKPWVPLAKDLEDGNAMKNWIDREPFAFWKGNLYTGPRKKLAECNSTEKWNAQIINQDWAKEFREGFRNSDLSKQCVNRYKIYMEGNAWSVSEKYILACDSMTLLIDPKYYDFFSRSLIPVKHFWPIDPKNLCKSIKFAVNWGNNNTDKAQEIGKAGSEFVLNHVKMVHVYDYMFHLLFEYAKLLKYRPTVPEGAVELCSERFACSPMGRETDYKTETMVKGPSERGPCVLPPPYDSDTRQALRDQNANIRKGVRLWEKNSG